MTDDAARALGADWVVDWARRTAAAVDERRAELNALDREIGDGDHGENLDRGFRAAVARLDADRPPTPGAALRALATALISTVGGASGPLLGTALLRASSTAGDAATLDGAGIAAALAAAAAGVAERGRAQPGDKTMVDAWAPAALAAAGAADAGEAAPAVLRAAATAAVGGVEATVGLVARRGRASYLGDRAVGHADPGAVSTALLLEAAAEAAEAPR